MAVTEIIRSARLILTPLEPPDAVEMVEVLADPALYAFTGGEPPPAAAQGDDPYITALIGGGSVAGLPALGVMRVLAPCLGIGVVRSLVSVPWATTWTVLEGRSGR